MTGIVIGGILLAELNQRKVQKAREPIRKISKTAPTYRVPLGIAGRQFPDRVGHIYWKSSHGPMTTSMRPATTQSLNGHYPLRLETTGVDK